MTKHEQTGLGKAESGSAPMPQITVSSGALPGCTAQAIEESGMRDLSPEGGSAPRRKIDLSTVSGPCGSTFKCKARAANMGANDPQDCDWPVCGCDEHADKVIETLIESGWGKLESGSSPAQDDGRCGECVVADQLQCVLDRDHEGGCMFAYWPYRERSAATKLAVRPEPTGPGGTLGLDGDTRRCCNTPGCGYDYQHMGPCEPPATERAMAGARQWMACLNPRPEIVAVSSSVWGIKYNGQMVCAPTIEEAVSVLRSAIAGNVEAKEK
jgi:hypothetical protein